MLLVPNRSLKNPARKQWSYRVLAAPVLSNNEALFAQPS
jgi:hypothetical protein